MRNDEPREADRPLPDAALDAVLSAPGHCQATTAARLAAEVKALRACLRENIEDAGLVNGRARIIKRCQALLPADPVERKA